MFEDKWLFLRLSMLKSLHPWHFPVHLSSLSPTLRSTPMPLSVEYIKEKSVTFDLLQTCKIYIVLYVRFKEINKNMKHVNHKSILFFYWSSSKTQPLFIHCLCFAGCWSLQFERGSGLVTLRSLWWNGFVFFHVPGTRRFGHVYVGIGEKNLDLPFMLWIRPKIIRCWRKVEWHYYNECMKKV